MNDRNEELQSASFETDSFRGPGRLRRRSYYRVAGRLPIRVSPIREDAIETAVFELSMPAASSHAADLEEEDDSPLMHRLLRIEAKLDRLLGSADVDLPAPLAAENLEQLVFSGSGLSMPVDAFFQKGDAFRVEILLPAPYSRLVRGVGRAVETAKPMPEAVARFCLALALEHMNQADRDALIAYSYDLQRIDLQRIAQRSRDPQMEPH